MENKVKFYFALIKNELVSNRYYIVLSIIISLLTVLPQYFVATSTNRMISISILLLLLIISSKFSKVLFSLLVMYINIINIIIIHIAIHWGYNGIAGTRLEIVAESPLFESIGYIENFVDYRDYLFILYIILIFYLLYKFIFKFNNSFKKLRVISLPVTVILLFILHGHEPLNVFQQYLDAHKLSKHIINRQQFLKQKSIKNIKNNTSILYDKIVIIIGESVNKHHMQIYGYNKETTPFLKKLENDKHFYKFDVISGANSTRIAVPLLLTDANVSNFWYGFEHSQSIITDYKKNGFNTFWISSQEQHGINNTSISNIANEADKQVFFNAEYTATAKKDIEIVKYLKKNNLNHSQKELFILHLIGSHYEYSDRYDSEHILFKNAVKIEEKYDNTIFYTDYVIKEIYKYFMKQKKSLLLVYISDHGEVVSELKYGHGFYPGTHKDEYEIPFIVYSSIANTRLDNLMLKNNKKINIENFKSIINYITGKDPNLQISYSKDVIAVDPRNIIEYNKLKFYQEN